jgi:hypothetical protein
MLDPPDEPELEVTLPSVCSMDVKTPRLESTKYRKATATNSTTQATSDMRKLNFITDHGSSREMTRSARRVGVWLPALAPTAAEAPAEAPEPALYRPRDTAENVEVRLRELSFTAVVGLSAGAGGLMGGGLAWPVLGLAELGLLVLVLADPPAGSVSEAGYGGTAEVVSAGDPGS